MNLINCNFYSLRTHNNPKLLYFNYTTQPLYKRLSYYKSRYKRYINNHDNYIIAFEIIKYKDVYIELEKQIELDKDGKNKDVLNGILNKYIRENDCINKNKIQYEDNNIDIKNIKNDNNIIDTNNTDNIIDINTTNNQINNKSCIVKKKSNNTKTFKNYQNNSQDITTKKVLSFVDDLIDNSNNNINDISSNIIDNNDNNNDNVKDTNDISSNIIDNNDNIKDTNDNQDIETNNTDNSDDNRTYDNQNYIKDIEGIYRQINKNKDNKIDDNTSLKSKDRQSSWVDEYKNLMKKQSNCYKTKIQEHNKTKKSISYENIDDFKIKNNHKKTLKVNKLQ